MKIYKEKYQLLFENAMNAIYIVDAESFNILDANRQAIVQSRYSKEELLGMKCLELMPEDSLKTIEPLIEELKTKGRIQFEHTHKRKDDSLYPVEISAQMVDYGAGKVIQAYVRDISERKRSAVEVVNALLIGQEKERKRISQELHDGLGQLLSGLKLHTQLIGIRHKDIKQEADKIMLLASEAIREYRAVSHDLAPPALKENGLKMALDEMAERINGSEEVFVECESKGGYTRLPMNKEIEIFRMAQELVNNALKHSSASKIYIKLSKKNNKQLLIVKDNGIGFDMNSVHSISNGIGLSNLSQRAKLIDSKFDINSSPGKGTEAILEINTEQ